MNGILLTGGGFANKGAEALLKTVKDELGRRLGPVAFHAIVPAAQTSDALSAGFIPLNARNRQEFAAYHLGRVQQLNAAQTWAAASQAGRHLEWVRQCAAVLDVSGYAYADRFGSYPINLTGKIVSGCEAASVPYVFMPQAWGPLIRPYSRQSIRRIAERATMIYARDKTSFECLRSVPEIPAHKLELAPDIVLRFEPREDRNTLEPLERAGLLPKNCQRVGICPNIKIYNATEKEGTGPANPYVRWLAELCNRFLNETDAELVLFAHEMSPSWWRRDDRHVCRLVRDSVGPDERVKCFAEQSSADTLKLLVKQLDFLVGSRFHSIIAAFSLHVPAVAIGWSHKYHEVLNDAGVGELAFSYEAMRNEATLTRILEAWANREQVRRRLQQSVPVMKQKVDRVFDRVAELLRRTECC